MQELHFVVPMAGRFLCTLNTRHDSNMLTTLLRHSETKVLVVDHQFLDTALAAIDFLIKPPLLVIISEDVVLPPCDQTTNAYEYESLVEGGIIGFSVVRPTDEWDPISVNYTPGMTSKPKGVVYSHRGAYLNSIATVFVHGMGAML